MSSNPTTPSQQKKQPKPDLIVKVLGRSVPIKFVSKSKESLSDGELGEFSSVPPMIHILADLDHESRKRVAVHELVHAALAFAGLSEYHIDEKVEESICTVMESAFGDIYEALQKMDNNKE